MNIRQKYDHWTSSEMQDRLEKLLKQADSLWPYPKSDFVPPKKDIVTVTLDDDEELTGRVLVSYSFGDIREHETNAWVEMFLEVINQLYLQNPGVIRILATDTSYEQIIYTTDDKNADWAKIDENIYVYKANSTSAKMRILNRLFDEYGKDKSELIFNLKPEE